MLGSAAVNTISAHPHRCPAEDGLAAEHAGELLQTRMDISWMAVELLRKVADVLRPLGRPQAEDLM